MGLTPWFSSFLGIRRHYEPFSALMLPLLFANLHTPSPTEGMVFADLVLVIGTLGFCAGHYRIQSILQHIFPIDPRKKQRQTAEKQRISGFWAPRDRSLWKRNGPVRDGDSEGNCLARRKPIPFVGGALAEVGWLLLSSNRGQPNSKYAVWGLWRVILLMWVSWLDHGARRICR